MRLSHWDRFTMLDDALNSIGAARSSMEIADDRDGDIIDLLDEAEIIVKHRRGIVYDDISASDYAELQRDIANARMEAL